MTQTKQIRRAVLVLAGVTLLLAGHAVTQAQAKIDITGTWNFTVLSPVGNTQPTATFKVQGENVTGTITSASFGERPITGTLKGQALEFKYQTEVAGEILYRGTVESNDAIKGTVYIKNGDSNGTFTAQRKK